MSGKDNFSMTFIAKDDGKERRISLLVEGKHGMIGFIRPDKPPTERDKQMFLETLAKVAIETAEVQARLNITVKSENGGYI